MGFCGQLWEITKTHQCHKKKTRKNPEFPKTRERSYLALIETDDESGIVRYFDVVEDHFVAVCLLAKVLGHVSQSGRRLLVWIHFRMFLKSGKNSVAVVN